MAKRKEKEDFASLPACAVEFIKLVIRKMLYRRKVRLEVQAELIGHFEDALKDCQNEEEKEQEARQLIADFGDAKLLAVLLRRAKRRCRPLWRTVVARTFQTIGVLILCFILYVVWFFMGRPVVTIDYVAELNRMVRPVADESLNAAASYKKAADLCAELPDDICRLLETKYEEATAERIQLIERCLVDNKDALELVVAGTKKPFYWQKYSNEKEEFGMMGILLPNLSEFRKLTFCLRWRAQLRAQSGQYKDAFEDIKTCYRFGQHIKQAGTIVEQLYGMAIEAVAVGALRGVLSEYEIDASILATLQKEFEQIVTNEDFVLDLEVEKLGIYDQIQRCFTQGRFGWSHLYLQRLFGIIRMLGYEDEDSLSCFGWSHLYLQGLFDMRGGYEDAASLSFVVKVLFTQPDKQQTKETVERLFDFWEKVSHRSPAQLHVGQMDIKEETMKIIKGNLFLEILTPYYWGIFEQSHRLPTDVNAALAIVAILRFKQDTGHLPENLNELVTAGYLKKLPMDAYSDKPIVYRRTDEDFILYSVGPNFTDDGGISGGDRGRKGKGRSWYDEDMVFWPRE